MQVACGGAEKCRTGNLHSRLVSPVQADVIAAHCGLPLYMSFFASDPSDICTVNFGICLCIYHVSLPTSGDVQTSVGFVQQKLNLLIFSLQTGYNYLFIFSTKDLPSGSSKTPPGCGGGCDI